MGQGNGGGGVGGLLLSSNLVQVKVLFSLEEGGEDLDEGREYCFGAPSSSGGRSGHEAAQELVQVKGRGWCREAGQMHLVNCLGTL